MNQRLLNDKFGSIIINNWSFGINHYTALGPWWLYHWHELAGAFINACMGPLDHLRLIWHGGHLWSFYCYRPTLFLTRDPKFHSVALTTGIIRIKEKSHEIFIQKKMLYFIHLPVALSNKYTTHALDKLLEHAAIVNSEKVNMFLKCHQRKKTRIMWLVFYII